MFFEIKAIIIIPNNQIIVLAKQIALSYFFEHYQAYEILNDLEICSWWIFICKY